MSAYALTRPCNDIPHVELILVDAHVFHEVVRDSVRYVAPVELETEEAQRQYGHDEQIEPVVNISTPSQLRLSRKNPLPLCRPLFLRSPVWRRQCPFVVATDIIAIVQVLLVDGRSHDDQSTSDLPKDR
jgi:hypothetical protein